MCKMPRSENEAGDLEKVADFAVRWKADAIIGQFNENDDLGIFRDKGIIVIAQDYHSRIPSVSNITSDYRAQGRDLAQFFIKRGAHNFAFYGLSGMVWSDERRDGFFSCISQSLSSYTSSILERPCTQDIWWYDSEKLLEWLISLPKPVAILACDDNMAFHIIETCNQYDEYGLRVPYDIMLMGVDNDELLCNLCSPALTSYKSMIENAGYEVAKQLDERMKLPLQERLDACSDIIVMPGYIVPRRSTDAFLHQNQYIRTVCDYISNNYTEKIKVDDLVSLVPMSRRILEKLFASEMKSSIHQFIIKTRVDRMISLMAEGKSPKEAAEIMNMDLKALSRCFKALKGMNPTDYMNKCFESKMQ